MKYNPLRNTIVAYILVIIFVVSVIITNSIKLPETITLICSFILMLLGTCDLIRWIDYRNSKDDYKAIKLLIKRNKELEGMLNQITLEEIIDKYEKYHKAIVINDGKVIGFTEV